MLLIYLPRKNERLSRPGWLTYSGWFTQISGPSSAGGRAQDSESSLVNGRHSTTVPRNQNTSLLMTTVQKCTSAVVLKHNKVLFILADTHTDISVQQIVCYVHWCFADKCI